MTEPDFWSRMAARGPAEAVVGGVRIEAGSRVRLTPRSRADIFDVALRDRIAIVESVEEDEKGSPLLAVVLEDDPGRDLGEARLPGHRFFYSVDEVEPLDSDVDRVVRILIAGIGNLFLGDDGFGVEVVRRLAERPAMPGVDVVDFGIRGMDLVYAMQRNYHAVIFVDAAPRGEPPGTLTVLEPDTSEVDRAAPETHGMDPVRVLRLARDLGRMPERTLVVCCEPDTVPPQGPGEDLHVALSPPVESALDDAVRLTESLVDELLEEFGLPTEREHHSHGQGVNRYA